MAASGLDYCLMCLVFLVVLVDIILGLCLRFVLPLHLTSENYYAADGRKEEYRQAIKICPCLTKVFPEGTNVPITFNKVEKKVTQRVKREIYSSDIYQQDIIKQYPFIASLSMPIFNDDRELKMFICNGLIQNRDWLITNENCVKEESEWFNVSIRSGSSYWSKFGQEHIVIQVSHTFGNLVGIKVAPKFDKELVPYPPLQYPPQERWKRAFSLGWDDKMYNKNIFYRHKYKPFEVENWTSDKCDSQSNNVCYYNSENLELSSKVLLTTCHRFVGMKLAIQDKFVDPLHKNRTNILGGQDCYKIYRDTCSFDEKVVC